MRRLTPWLALLVLTPAQAAPDLLDLVPANAALVVGANGIKPFTDKLDKVIIAVDPGQAGIGAIVNLMAGQFGLATALDTTAPLAFVMASPQEVLGKALNPNGTDAPNLFVGTLGYADEEKLAKDLGIDLKQQPPGKVFDWKSANMPAPIKALYENKRLYLATSEKAIQSVRQGKRLRAVLTKEHAATLGRADALVLASPAGWENEWKLGLQMLRGLLPMPGNDTLLPELLDTVAELRYAAIGVRLDGGVGVNALAAFAPSPKVAGVLAKLSGGTTAALTALPLPEGSLLFAQGAVGDGKETAAILRLLTTLETPNGVGLHALFAKADQPALQAVFAALWKRLKGDRLAVYQPKNPRAGQLAALAILDSDDPAAFLAEVRKVVRLGNPNELRLGEPGPKDDRAVVEKLIKELGSDDFDVREKATTALTVLGRPALPYLEAALKSGDAEIARRAKDLHAEITQGAAEKRTELLSGKLPYQVPPTLRYFPATEKRAGLDVDLIQITLDKKDEGLAPKLRELLGPDWDKVRIVRREKSALVLFGSDLTLLEGALENLTKNAPGLERWPTLKDFRAHADAARKLEAHWAFVRFLALTVPLAEGRFKEADKAGVTSASFAVGTDRLQVDLWMPATEIRGLVYLVQEGQKRAGVVPP